MHLISLLVLSATLGASLNAATTGSPGSPIPEPSQGAVTENLGRVGFKKGSLLINIRFDLFEYIRESAVRIYHASNLFLDNLSKASLFKTHLASLQAKTSQACYIFLSLLERLPPTIIKTELNAFDIKTFEASYRERFVLAFANVNITDANISEPLAVPKGRVKRGWINAGGSLLNTVFGTATDAELAVLNTKIDNYNVEISRSARTILVQARQMRSLVNNALFQVRNIAGQLSQTVHVLEELSSYVALAQMIENLGDATQFLLTVALDADLKLQSLREGRMPSLISYDKFIDIINEGNKKLKPLNFPLAFPTDIGSIIETVQIHPSNDPYTFIVELPFTGELMSLYRVHPYPMMYMDNYVIPQNTHPYLAVGRQHFTTLSVLNGCITVYSQNLTLCSVPSVLNPTNVQDCTHNIVKRNSTETCIFKTFSASHLILKIQHYWVIFLKKPTLATVTCPLNDIAFRKYEGTLIINTLCSFRSQRLVVPSIITPMITTWNSSLDYSPIVNLNITAFANNTPIHLLNNNIDQVYSSINDTIDKINNITVAGDIISYSTTVKHSLSYSLIVLLFLLLFLILLFKFFRKRNADPTFSLVSYLKGKQDVNISDPPRHSTAPVSPQLQPAIPMIESRPCSPSTTSCTPRMARKPTFLPMPLPMPPAFVPSANLADVNIATAPEKPERKRPTKEVYATLQELSTLQDIYMDMTVTSTESTV